ncbi:HAMP domain-containing histidine kinase [Erysipelothrix sp. HDW6C]|uniref:sensor histidine kinase n=1 Tax=Erysipelothrix sp. HDW6C TaxID=2714930 RepID=UPI00140E15B6|nr:HAMP domain-containing sensor histidine kinase [Erysipelothrix sp. HDW6C]QIK70818.1 HAMP domain-containing histidine kinase [Erysipelothrix sp. HDW6C]
MKLSRKVFLYTAATTFLVGVLIIGYFVFMLPGLYTDYKLESFRNSVTQSQSNMMEGKPCTIDAETIETYSSMSLAIPDTGYTIKACNTFMSVDLTLEDETLKHVFDQMRTVMKSIDSADVDFEEELAKIDFEQLQSLFGNTQFNNLVSAENFEGIQTFVESSNAIQDYTITADGSLVMSVEVGNDANRFMNYVAFGEKEGAIFITVGSAMTPKLNELKPIILSSVPMIVCLLILFVLITARMFTKMLATPIETLAHQATSRQERDGTVFKQPNQHDEFKILEDALNHMHRDLKASIVTVENQNQALIREKEKQELFLMNASHQLKTPVAGASLLVEGMLGKVGKFAETDTYLPKVRDELGRMQSIIESMMVVFQETDRTLEIADTNVETLVQAVLQQYRERIQSKNLSIHEHTTAVTIQTDAEILVSIIDNVIGNAVKYTPNSKSITLELSNASLIVTSHGVWIDASTLEHVKEAFVRSHHSDEKGTGLGLYLVDNMMSVLGLEWTIENSKVGVCVTLYLKGE